VTPVAVVQRRVGDVVILGERLGPALVLDPLVVGVAGLGVVRVLGLELADDVVDVRRVLALGRAIVPQRRAIADAVEGRVIGVALRLDRGLRMCVGLGYW